MVLKPETRNMRSNEEEIKYLEKRLNNVEVVDGKWYRLNHCSYEIVCYVNNIIALHFSGNYVGIPIFIKRTKNFLSSKEHTFLKSEYIDLVNQYINLIELEISKVTNDN